MPAEHALHELEALSVSLSHWERDRALLRTLVNVGSLLPHEQRFPRDEVYPAAVDDAIARINDEPAGQVRARLPHHARHGVRDPAHRDERAAAGRRPALGRAVGHRPARARARPPRRPAGGRRPPGRRA
ncbi:hypothetical protein GCM10025868_39310 [Angustibacter aerolatus]|uniref:DUF222 domain-containing protein n=1 Tax=Angustibacter aerolatus TaxID=1162965 RepID=A0ABQ6JM95_9ACTN|nr:hypothetical protein GCM10025868_39310 [Angustibacter aerolatus]